MSSAIVQSLDSQGHIVTTMQGLPSGRGGVKDVLKAMRAAALHGRADPIIRELALSIVSGIRNNDYAAEARAVQVWIQQNIRYTRDPSGMELLQSPRVTLKTKQGDCDDQTALICALLGSIGHALRMVAIGFKPDRFSHVYAEVFINGLWMAAETIRPWALGQNPKNARMRMVAPFSEGATIEGFKLKNIFKPSVVLNPVKAVEQVKQVVKDPPKPAQVVSQLKPMAIVSAVKESKDSALNKAKEAAKDVVSKDKITQVLSKQAGVTEKLVSKTQPTFLQKIFGQRYSRHLANTMVGGGVLAYQLDKAAADARGENGTRVALRNAGTSAQVIGTALSFGAGGAASGAANAARAVGAAGAVIATADQALAAREAKAYAANLEPDYTAQYIDELKKQLSAAQLVAPVAGSPAALALESARNAPAGTAKPTLTEQVSEVWNRATPVEKTGLVLGGSGLLMTFLQALK